jgi:hypothetical protein
VSNSVHLQPTFEQSHHHHHHKRIIQWSYQADHERHSLFIKAIKIKKGTTVNAHILKGFLR